MFALANVGPKRLTRNDRCSTIGGEFGPFLIPLQHRPRGESLGFNLQRITGVL